ncbi:MAG: DUF512 domain-containing protein [Christensenellaceae bacterium]|nr:DUF512 domain-containing protein [Christensenellaceae bacterium]
MALIVKQVHDGSIAREAGLRSGDLLLRINGEEIIDQIDYLYFSALEELTLEVQRPGQQPVQIEIEKDADEPLGLDYEGDGFGKKRSCHNKCVFCFIDQLPSGMRDTLYFKDDDWRMSFVMGNYITLTNVNEQEFERILRRKTSPLYISVHATDDDVREKILNQKKGRGLLSRLQRLCEAGIDFECQAVLAEGLNDGEVLDKTIADLEQFFPHARSLALVPVGLTGHRDGLYPLSPMTREGAAAILDLMEKWQKRFLEKYGRRFVFGADELYIKAGRELPSYDEYEGFAQLEDGVGLLRSLMDEVSWALEEVNEPSAYREVSIATGVDAAPYIRALADSCEQKLHMTIHVYPIVNHFFGKTITVSGLITAGDMIDQLKGKPLGEKLFFSNSLLRDGEDHVFLDDVTIDKLCDIIKVPCQSVYNDGYDFVGKLAGRNIE